MERLMFSENGVKRKYLAFHGFIRFFIIGLIVFVINSHPIAAQGTSQWIPDQKVPGYIDETFLTPFLVADQNKTIHAFAVQTLGEDNRQYTIVYNQWSQNKGWTTPVDILFFPSGLVKIIGVFLDSSGIVHMAFFGSEGYDASLYYTHAQIARAGDVSAWSLPVEVGVEALGPCFGVMAGDNKGNLVILYNGKMDGKGVYAVTSNDAGYSWSKTTPIFLTYDDQLAPFSVNGYMGESGRLHIVWNILDLANQYVALYYNNLDVDSNQWGKPVLLVERPDVTGFFGPATPFVVDNGKNVVIMYNGGNPYTDQPVPFGRPTLLVRTSTDNGESWSVATNPFPLLTGSSGEHSLVIDSNQNIHALAFMRIDRVINGEYSAIFGMWHSELRNNNWSNPERTDISIRPLSLRAVVSQGNVLLATWIEESVTGGGSGIHIPC